jgi:hypothetical protein
MPDSDKPGDLEPKGSAEDLPPVIPPPTKAAFQFNQQVNIQPIPPRAWERLSPEQIVELSKDTMAQLDRMDQRHFDWAMNQARTSQTVQEKAMVIGGVIAVLGLVAVTYLAATGHEIVAAILGTFLATILAVVVGNRLFGQQ